jgi:hypothetical protein
MGGLYFFRHAFLIVAGYDFFSKKLKKKRPKQEKIRKKILPT